MSRSVEMVLLSITLSTQTHHSHPQCTHEKAEMWSKWHKIADHGLASTSLQERAGKHTLRLLELEGTVSFLSSSTGTR